MARRFCLNTFFFFLFPCLFCCGACCRWRDSFPRGHNDESREHFTIHQTKYSRPIENAYESNSNSDESSSEKDLLLKKKPSREWTRHRDEASVAAERTRLRAAGIAEDLERNLEEVVQVQKVASQNQLTLGNPTTLDIDSIQEAEEEEDTSFVLSALTESRDSLKMLVSSG